MINSCGDDFINMELIIAEFAVNASYSSCSKSSDNFLQKSKSGASFVLLLHCNICNNNFLKSSKLSSFIWFSNSILYFFKYKFLIFFKYQSGLDAKISIRGL